MTLKSLRHLADRFRRAKAQFPEYRATLAWVLRDLCRVYPGAMLKLVFFSLVGASLQGAVLMAAIQYVHALEGGSSLTIQGISIATQGGHRLSLAVAVFLLLLVLSAVVLYLAKALLARLVADYHVHLLKQALSLFGTVVPGQPAPQNPSEALQLIIKTVTQDAQKTVMLVRFFGQALPSSIILLYAFPILIYIDLPMTMLLMVLVLAFVPFFYQANLMAYLSNLMAKRSGKEAKNTLTALMEELNDYQNISPKQAKIINKAFRRGGLKDKIEYIPVFLRSLARTELWSNILLSVAVSLVIVVQVPGALAGETPWSMLIGYLVFLRLAVNSFKALMSFLAKFSRYYPYIHRYHTFVKSAQLDSKKGQAMAVKAASYGIVEHNSQVSIQDPLLLALFTRVPLTRYTFPYMVKLGEASDNGIYVSPHECFFIGRHGLPQQDASLRDMLGLPEGFTAQDLENIMPADLFQEIKAHLGLDLDLYRGPLKWGKLSQAHRVELGIVASLLCPARAVVIDKSMLQRIPAERSRALLSQLAQKKELTIISYPEQDLHELASQLQFQEPLCAVSGSTGNLLALGSPAWAQDQLEAILDLLDKEQARLQHAMVDGDNDEDMEEDE